MGKKNKKKKDKKKKMTAPDLQSIALYMAKQSLLKIMKSTTTINDNEINFSECIAESAKSAEYIPVEKIIDVEKEGPKNPTLVEVDTDKLSYPSNYSKSVKDMTKSKVTYVFVVTPKLMKKIIDGKDNGIFPFISSLPFVFDVMLNSTFKNLKKKISKDKGLRILRLYDILVPEVVLETNINNSSVLEEVKDVIYFDCLFIIDDEDISLKDDNIINDIIKKLGIVDVMSNGLYSIYNLSYPNVINYKH